MATLEITLTDVGEKGAFLAAEFYNETEAAAAAQRKEEFTPLSPTEYASLRFNQAAESWYYERTKVDVEPLKAKLEKLTDAQRADIQTRINAYVPDAAAEAVK